MDLALKLIQKEKKEKTGRLDIGYCDLTVIPEEVFELTWLETLIVSNKYIDFKTKRFTTSINSGKRNIIKKIPDNIAKLNNLKILYLGGFVFDKWEIKNIKPLQTLKNLEKLDLWFNQIWNITPLENLTQLTELRLNFNQISDINPIKNLNKLNILDITSNKILNIKSLEDLKQLTELRLSNNQISDIKSLKNLTVLNTLELNNNQISDISPLLPLIEKGLDINEEYASRGISIGNNPLEKPPMSVIQQGKKAVLAYFKALEKGNEKRVNEVKLILLGNSAAGKTSIARYLTSDKVNKNISSTHGIELSHWTIPKFFDKKDDLKVSIFDFGGQEYYHDTHQLFFTRQTAYAVIWEKNTDAYDNMPVDIKYGDNEKVSVNIDVFPLEYWLDAINYFTVEKNYDYKEVEKILSYFGKTNYLSDLPLSSRFESAKKKFENIKKTKQNFFTTKSYQFESTEEEFQIDLTIIKVIIDKFLSNEKELKQAVISNAPTFIIQNRKEKEGETDEQIFINNQAIKEDYPFVYDITALSFYNHNKLENIKELLSEMFAQMEIVGYTYPVEWYKIRTKIEKKKENYQFIYKLATELYDEGLTDNNAISGLLAMLKSIGILHYNPDNFNLYAIQKAYNESKDKVQELIKKQQEAARPDDVVFFDMNWLLNQIYKILNHYLEKKRGVFDTNDMKKALGKKTMDSEYKLLLNLMKEKHLIVDYPEQEKGSIKKYIATQYLPAKAEDNVQLFLRSFHHPILKVEYIGFIHKSLVMEFFAEYSKYVYRVKKPDETFEFYFWRDGIVLSFGDKDLILVEFNKPDDKTGKPYISIRTQENKYSDKVKEILDKIIAISDKNRYKYEVYYTLNGLNFVPSSKIKNAIKKQHPVFEYENKIYQLGDFNKYLDTKFPMKKAFISYSSKDVEFMKRFEVHLAMLKRNNYISVWHDRMLEPGDWDKQIRKELEEADIIFFLLSPDFLNTDYIWDIEIKRAFERKEKGEVIIFPVHIRDCMFEQTPFANVTIYPKKAEPIRNIHNDELWKKVIEQIIATIEK